MNLTISVLKQFSSVQRKGVWKKPVYHLDWLHMWMFLIFSMVFQYDFNKGNVGDIKTMQGLVYIKIPFLFIKKIKPSLQKFFNVSNIMSKFIKNS